MITWLLQWLFFLLPLPPYFPFSLNKTISNSRLKSEGTGKYQNRCFLFLGNHNRLIWFIETAFRFLSSERPGCFCGVLNQRVTIVFLVLFVFSDRTPVPFKVCLSFFLTFFSYYTQRLYNNPSLLILAFQSIITCTRSSLDRLTCSDATVVKSDFIHHRLFYAFNQTCFGFCVVRWDRNYATENTTKNDKRNVYIVLIDWITTDDLFTDSHPIYTMWSGAFIPSDTPIQ